MAGIIELADQHLRGPISWSNNDCCAGACNIFRDIHGVDPMKPLRGRYKTMGQIRRILWSFGGWVPMTTWLAATSGLVEVLDGGRVGDIALSREGVGDMPGEGRMLLISAGGAGWIGKTSHGYAILRQSDLIERCWTCPKPSQVL